MHQAPALVVALLVLVQLAPAAPAETVALSDPVVMLAAAVAESGTGFIGSTATITIRSASNGAGHVFLDTFPLTEVDMQGSARLATRVAAQLTGHDRHTYDLFFVVRSGSQQIGGPSAGASMAVGAIAAMNGWKVRDDTLLTGSINPDATIGPVGGIAEKANAAAKAGMRRFLYPAGQDVVPLGPDRVVNVSQHCATELQIECIGVADIIDAIGLMTDHIIARPPIGGDVTGDDFRQRLAPLGAQLVADAETLYAEATLAHNATPASGAKEALRETLAGARRLLDQAATEVANGTYYTAASTSFRASIEARYVREASEYLAAPDPEGALLRTIIESETDLERAKRLIDNAAVRDTNSFEAYGAAQVRLLEAEDRIGNARQLQSAPSGTADVFLALRQSAHGAERARTAQWWLQLAEGFPRGQPVEPAALQEIARDTITTSKEELAYVEAVFASAGSLGQLTTPRDLLAKAEEAMTRNFYAAAILDALEASVRASVILEIAAFGGDVPASTLEVARENAARAIQGARARGIESVLAQSAYELGTSLDAPYEKMSFLGLARVTGNLAGLPGLFSGTTPPESRFQGIATPHRVDAVYVIAGFAVGIALGVGSGLAAMMPKKEED